MAKVFQVVVAGTPLACQHCGHVRFSRISHGFYGVFVQFWSFVCRRCGHLHTFTKNAGVEATRVD